MGANVDLGALFDCINFAAIKHKNQRRKDSDQTPYINHPIGVARILACEGGVTDVDVLKAAVLHDTVEDTDTTNEEIKQHFGEKIAKIVDEVSDDKDLSKQERKQQQIVNAPHKSHQAKLVKLADFLYNLRDLNRQTPVGWSEERVREYFVWASKVISGLRNTHADLEAKLDELFKQRNVELS